MSYIGRRASKTALNSADIPDDSITAAKIVDGTIAVGDIGTNAVGADELANDAVDTNAIADDAVTGAKIENNPTIAGNLTVSGDLVPSTPLSSRNMIINGAMAVSQRAITSTTRNTYQICDRFAVKDSENLNQLALTHIQADTTDYEDCAGIRKSYKVTINTAETALAADEQLSLEYRVEAQDLAHLKYGTSSAESITLSFYVRSNKNGAYALGVQSHDADKNIGTTYTVANTDWQRVTWTIPGLTTSGINNDNGIGFMIKWFLSAGDNMTSTSNTSWDTNAGNRYAYGQTADLMAESSNYWEITGVQLELGSSATPFEHRSYGDELLRCQRYCFKTYAEDALTEAIGCGYWQATNAAMIYVYLPVTMSKWPSVTATGSDWYVSYGSNSSAGSTVAFNNADIGDTGPVSVVGIRFGGLSGGTVGHAAAIMSKNADVALFLENEL